MFQSLETMKLSQYQYLTDKEIVPVQSFSLWAAFKIRQVRAGIPPAMVVGHLGGQGMKKRMLQAGRQEFSARLRAALERAGVDPTPANLAKHFNARAGDFAVTAHGVRKWLDGLAMPSNERLEILARWLRVTP